MGLLHVPDEAVVGYVELTSVTDVIATICELMNIHLPNLAVRSIHPRGAWRSRP